MIRCADLLTWRGVKVTLFVIPGELELAPSESGNLI